MKDLTCLGELLIDFVQNTSAEQLTATYQANAGGAPGNVACAGQALGLNTAFIGAVGKDALGDLLVQALNSFSVDISGISQLPEHPTTLAFVSLSEGGQRDFSFYRHKTADTQLKLKEEHLALLDSSRFLHFGTLSLTDEPSKTSSFEAIYRLRNNGGICGFDPNVRTSLWENTEDLISAYRKGVELSDILKIGDEDLFLLEGNNVDVDATIEQMLSNGVHIVLLTLGKKGSEAYWLHDGQVLKATAPTDLSRIAVDSTGAGDIFTGAIYSRILPEIYACNGSNTREQLINYVAQLQPDQMSRHLLFANQIASLSTEKHGGITSIPSINDWKKVYGEAN